MTQNALHKIFCPKYDPLFGAKTGEIKMLKNCIGMKIIAVKSFNTNRRKTKGFEPGYILFDDGKTYIELDDQDYDFHDCDPSAKTIEVRTDPRHWKQIFENENGQYPDADMDI
jgi:hypothetical protein